MKKFLILSLILLGIFSSLKSQITNNNLKFLNEKENPTNNILSEKIFGLNVKCNTKILGTNEANIQHLNNDHTIIALDIEKNFELLAIENDDVYNPQKIKTYKTVIDYKRKKYARYFITSDGYLHVEPQKNRFGVENYFYPCLNFVQNFQILIDSYKISEKSEMDETDKLIGDEKYSYNTKESKDDLVFNYYFKNSEFTYLKKTYPAHDAWSRDFTMDVLEAKKMKESDLEQVPIDANWEDFDH